MNQIIHNVFVTGECNLSCSFCFSERIRQGIPDDPDRILEEILRVQAPVVRFCGGEPLLKFHRLKEWVRHLADNVEVIINTNALCLTEEIVEWGNDNNVIFQVSVDGYDRGERPATALNLELIHKIDYLWVNQLLFYPEDVGKVFKLLNPDVHEVGLLYGQKLTDPEKVLQIKSAAQGRHLSRIDSGSYNEITTHHTGKTYYSDRNANTDYCVHTRKQLGEHVWNVLRNR